jgi:hypothetical protein
MKLCKFIDPAIVSVLMALENAGYDHSHRMRSNSDDSRVDVKSACQAGS